jgi:hypothetical protein
MNTLVFCNQAVSNGSLNILSYKKKYGKFGLSSSVILVRNVHDSKEFTIFSAFFIIIDRESQQHYARAAGEKKMVPYHLHKFPPNPIVHV